MNEKRRKAATLRYDQDRDNAPIVGAAGKGYVAKEIIKLAVDNNIPIIEDATLVEILAALNINEHIPEELYQVVAEVFAFIYQTDKKTVGKS